MELCCRWHWRSLLALPLSLAVAVLLLAAAVPPAAAQMLSPLAGQNSPNLNTTEVFMSVYLDRLLEGGCCGLAIAARLQQPAWRCGWCEQRPCRLPFLPAHAAVLSCSCLIMYLSIIMQWMRRTTGTARSSISS